MASRRPLSSFSNSFLRGCSRLAVQDGLSSRPWIQSRRSLPSSRIAKLWKPTAVSQTGQSYHQTRHHSASASKSRVYEFDEINKLSTSPKQDTILIDVRKPSEYDGGFIPSAINIDISSHPDALFLSPEEFQDAFGFPKPSPEKELVFYCKAGVRSSAAAQIAQQAGYDKVGEYRGSWNDWVSKGGINSKEGPRAPDQPGSGAGKSPI